MEEYKLRVIKEKEELEEKYNKLVNFLNNEAFKVKEEQFMDLTMQKDIMKSYLTILEIRIEKFNK